MTGYRVTKYNPECRDVDGRFLGAEWTSVFDIVGTLDGRREYVTMEDAYVKAICEFYEQAGSPCLDVVDLDRRQLDPQSMPEPLVADSERRLSRMASHDVAGREALEDVVRLALREIIWCRLESHSGFYVHFGYDFYAYVGGARLEVPERLPGGIYVEEMESPYAQQ